MRSSKGLELLLDVVGIEHSMVNNFIKFTKQGEIRHNKKAS